MQFLQISVYLAHADSHTEGMLATAWGIMVVPYKVMFTPLMET